MKKWIQQAFSGFKLTKEALEYLNARGMDETFAKQLGLKVWGSVEGLPPCPDAKFQEKYLDKKFPIFSLSQLTKNKETNYKKIFMDELNILFKPC